MPAHYRLRLIYTDQPEVMKRQRSGIFRPGESSPTFEQEVIKFSMPAGQEGKIMTASRARRLVKENDASFGILVAPRGHIVDFGEGSL